MVSKHAGRSNRHPHQSEHVTFISHNKHLQHTQQLFLLLQIRTQPSRAQQGAAHRGGRAG